MSSIPKRRKKVIDAITQSKIAIETFVQVLLFMALVIFIIYIQPFATLFSNFAAIHHQQLVEELFSINLSKWPLFVFVIGFMAFLNVLYSHKIVGPIYKLGMVIKSFTNRDFRTRMTLRKNDYFKEIIPLVNGMRQTVTKDVESIKVEIMRIQQFLHQGGKEDRIKDSLQIIDDILDQYQLESQDTLPRFDHDQLAKASFRSTKSDLEKEEDDSESSSASPSNESEKNSEPKA